MGRTALGRIFRWLFRQYKRQGLIVRLEDEADAAALIESLDADGETGEDGALDFLRGLEFVFGTEGGFRVRFESGEGPVVALKVDGGEGIRGALSGGGHQMGVYPFDPERLVGSVVNCEGEGYQNGGLAGDFDGGNVVERSGGWRLSALKKYDDAGDDEYRGQREHQGLDGRKIAFGGAEFVGDVDGRSGLERRAGICVGH